MKESTKRTMGTFGSVGLAFALISGTAHLGKADLDKQLAELNNARLVSQNPRVVVYDSDGDGNPDTSRGYIQGPTGGLFPFDRPSNQEELDAYRAE